MYEMPDLIRTVCGFGPIEWLTAALTIVAGTGARWTAKKIPATWLRVFSPWTPSTPVAAKILAVLTDPSTLWSDEYTNGPGKRYSARVNKDLGHTGRVYISVARLRYDTIYFYDAGMISSLKPLMSRRDYRRLSRLAVRKIKELRAAARKYELESLVKRIGV